MTTTKRPAKPKINYTELVKEIQKLDFADRILINRRTDLH
jgi:hypothetical protein